jgi:hypothetical protein
MDVGRLHIEDVLPARCRKTASLEDSLRSLQCSFTHRVNPATNLLGEEGHDVALVEEAQFPVLGLLVIRVPKDAPVQQSAVDIGDHATNVSRAVRLLVARV